MIPYNFHESAARKAVAPAATAVVAIESVVVGRSGLNSRILLSDGFFEHLVCMPDSISDFVSRRRVDDDWQAAVVAHM